MGLLIGWYIAIATRGMVGGSIIYLLIKSFILINRLFPHRRLKLLIIPLSLFILLMSPSLFAIMWKSPEILWGIAIILIFTGMDVVEKRSSLSPQLPLWWSFLGRSGKIISALIGALLIIALPIAFIDADTAQYILTDSAAATWFLFLECLRQRNHTLQLQHNSQNR